MIITRPWLAAVAVCLFIGCTDNNQTAGGGSGGATGSADGKSTAPAKDAPDLSSLSGTVTIDGSSTLYPVTEAVAEEFQKATKNNVHVTVGHGGTGSGFKRFARGEIEVCDASRPALQADLDALAAANIEFIEIPVCFDALTVAVHPSNKLDSIKVSELKKMWEPEAQGKVSRWNLVNPDWPDAELALFGAGSESGTFDYFTEAIVGKAKSSRGDYSPNEDDNALVQGIAGNKGALGYIPFYYYEENTDKLKALAIDWDKNNTGPVAPTLANVESGKYNPLSRPLFIYVNKKAAERPEVKSLVEFYLKNALELVTEIKYLPLPDIAYAHGLERFANLQTGTAFEGKQAIGLSIDEILKRQPH